MTPSLNHNKTFGMEIFDMHTHNLNAPAGRAIINVPHCVITGESTFTPQTDKLYSAGIHPWYLADETNTSIEKLEKLLTHPQITALGECGLDKIKGGTTLDKQIEIFKQQIILSEKYKKPLIIHCVHAFNELIQLYSQTNPIQTWIIHGFRGKPELASQLCSVGIHLSFGIHFNPISVYRCPESQIHIETDNSNSTIEEVYQTVSAIRTTL